MTSRSRTVPAGIVPGTHHVDPARSTVALSVRHLFGITAVRAASRVREGRLSVAADPWGSSVTASIDAASLTSGDRGRDRAVAGPAPLDARTHPDIRVESYRIRPQDDGIVVRGALTVRGTLEVLEAHVTAIEATADDVRVVAISATRTWTAGADEGRADR